MNIVVEGLWSWNNNYLVTKVCFYFVSSVYNIQIHHGGISVVSVYSNLWTILVARKYIIKTLSSVCMYV